MSYTIHGTFTAGSVNLTNNTVYQSLQFDDLLDTKTGIYRRELTTELNFLGTAYHLIKDEEGLGTCDIPIQIKYNGATKYEGNIKLNTSQAKQVVV